MIEFESLFVSYGGTPILHGLSERVSDGEWLAVVGPNGAGKTTLLRCAVGLVGYRGTARIAGAEIAHQSRRRLARLVAYVPQQPEFPFDLTVADYVLLGRTPHIGYFGSESAEDRRVSLELLDRLRLSAFAERRLGTLSGGELQRLVLARALAQDAPVLVLDEPTSALDLGRRVDALELVDELRRERGLTVVSAVHDLTLAGQFADRLLLLAGGHVVARGAPAEVLRPELLSEHFGVGVRVLAAPDGQLVVVSLRGTAVSGAPAALFDAQWESGDDQPDRVGLGG